MTLLLRPQLELRQSHGLVLTPQLQQAIKLLQLSHLELAQFVAAELEANPLLEREEPDATAGPPDADGDPAAWQSVRVKPLPADDLAGLERTAARPLTLREHLLAQLALEIADPADRRIGAELIEMVDEAGYLAGSLDELAVKLGCPVARILPVLERVQQFDPAGVCARDLGECLALQLAERDRLDPAMRALLDHLPLLAARDAAALTRLCGVDAEDLADMVAEIERLNPKPGLVFDAAPAIPVVPDILLRAAPGGAWTVELNDATLPRLLVNRRYYAEVGAAARPARDYLAERWQQANWLVKALDQRATTILKVTREIVRQQDAFFRHGVRHLKPLVLRDIAEAIGMHESTVSRVTANKYLLTPRGLFELKYFFTAAIASAKGGDAVSAEAVRARIKALIEREADAILSDDRIVALLNGDGVAIARRTVAKYRVAMHIPSSVERRRAIGMFAR